MKTFKRSKTSQAIVFNPSKISAPQKKASNALEKYEENIIFISSYIKQYLQELTIKQEKEKLKDKNLKSSNDVVENPKNMEINMNIFDFGTIKYILNKQKRSQDELLIIKTYLSSMAFLSTLKIPISNDRLLLSLSIYLKIEKNQKIQYFLHIFLKHYLIFFEGRQF